MMKTEITPEEIVSLLQNEGYRAVCEPCDINLTIHSASQGFAWEIFVGVTDESEASDFLIFSHSRSVSPVLFPVGRICNEFNTISPDGVATFSMDDNQDLTEDVMLSLNFSVKSLEKKKFPIRDRSRVSAVRTSPFETFLTMCRSTSELSLLA